MLYPIDVILSQMYHHLADLIIQVCSSPSTDAILGL